jgi:indolepyruvate ferredoxin oxidoreductase
MLLGTDPTDLAACETLLKNATCPDHYWGQDLSVVSEYYFGSKLYANMLLLGAACQLGRLPFSLDKLESAIARSVSSDDRVVNLKAFQVGRVLVISPEAFELPTKIYTYASLLEEKWRYLKESHGRKTADAYRHLVQEAVLELDIDDAVHRDVALRAYDLVHYEGLPLAQHYISLVLDTAAKDRREWAFEATKAVIHNAFKVMAIKDEIYVAHLLTSPEKRERDRLRYGIDEASGDRLEYHHLNRPEFTVFGKNIRWDMVTRDWQLNVMKRLRFLRKLLPAWHRDEKEFRDWYLNLAAHFDADDEKIYALWVRILRAPGDVRGYREIRKPLMDQAREKMETLEHEIRAHSKSPHRGRQSDAPTPERLRR